MFRICFLALILLVSVSTDAFAQLGNNTSVLNPNTASAGDLAGLTGMSEPLADTVVAGRPYLSMNALDEILAQDMSNDDRQALYEQLFLPINLNTASASEIRLIPGMSRKMEHEFEEYRPYTSLEQFRREMSKYVDQDEVARLEQFVFVPMNLNAAGNDDFATIPGISKKMIHEFEEYRPYSDMEQFRREIGKYVDEDEVNRLGRYVAVGDN